MMENKTIDNIRVENDYEHETVADIAAVLRRYVLPSLAERLEAAWKRERAEIEDIAKSKMLEGTIIVDNRSYGNAAATREALEGMCKASQDVFRSFARETFAGERRLDSLGRAFDKAQAALALPPRQCDVGTPYEQGNRMRQFCEKQKRNGIINCGYCPIKHQYQRDCTLAWAQTPYAEGGRDA